MRIALDGYPLIWPKTGVGHYTFELAMALARLAPSHTFDLIAPAEYPREIVEQIEQLPNLRAISVPTNVLTRRWWAVGLPRYLRREPHDLFHGTNYEVPLIGRGRHVLTVHDLSIFTHPETHDRRIARRSRRRLPIMVRSAARFITPTEAVKRELVERFEIDPNKVMVATNAPRGTFRPMSVDEAAAVRRRFGIDDEFILFVGTIEPRKNLKTLMRAFAELLDRTNHRPQLVIAGPRGWLTDEFDRVLGEMNLSDRVRQIGYVGDEELRGLYSSCRVFVYPSLNEGFGLPPLEAMACGAPVIASRIAAHEEVLNSHAVLINPNDESALSQGIIRLLENDDERQRLKQSGLTNAARFSWEKTAALTLEVYEQVLGAQFL